ncbi:thiamine pyrophosphate enzyme [Macroventuria anomochaeta]|uniref:Thiamine pyrophosphate enzyme n=1 Tax=Macroventuria anomochaeta TaxID=301207 RepID=A0ACB6RHN1_9PLEO|nr:thiamine pyrophosphate enzyme [Macroventuria anomochaeta]KAF2621420.1 thiamine pyrophosphate enzyme [Macroventuria anomochaeta]
MTDTVKLAEYLFTRLNQLGASAVHGVPGDFNLDLLDFVEPSGLLWVGNTNELNAGYAADGYSRIRGIGALVTTFGVGELSAINAIAGAYAERAPVVHIVGTPNRATQDGKVRVHHTFNDGNFRRFGQMHAHVTVAQTSLRDPLTAPQEIDRVLQQCLIHSRPVYIEVPVDLVEVPVRSANLKNPLKLPETLVTPATSDAISQVLDKLYAANRPIVLFDGECRALNITKEVQSIVEATKCPTWTTSYGRGLIDESLPNFQGVYKGAFDDQSIQNFFEQADLVLIFGPHFSTTNSYALTAKPNPELSIIFSDNEIEIGSTILRDIPARLAVSQLRKQLDISKIAQYSASDLQGLSWHDSSSISFSTVAKDEVIAHSKLWDLFTSFIRPGDIVMGETGTSGYGVREMRTPPNVRIFAPVTWLSIGYMLPAAQGAALAQRQMQAQSNGATDGKKANNGRTILFIGDGSLQMTVQEISTMIRHDLNVIIVVLNNDGYTIERAIHGLKESYNDVAAWRYLGAPSFFGAKEGTFTAQARTWGELEKVLSSKELTEGTGLRMVELFLDRKDVPKGPLAMLMGKEQKRMEGLKTKREVIP